MKKQANYFWNSMMIIQYEQKYSQKSTQNHQSKYICFRATDKLAICLYTQLKIAKTQLKLNLWVKKAYKNQVTQNLRRIQAMHFEKNVEELDW